MVGMWAFCFCWRMLCFGLELGSIWIGLKGKIEEGVRMKLKAFKHWLLPDHLSFLLLFPFLVWCAVAPCCWSFFGAGFLYWFTFLYDVLEEKVEALKRLELLLKS